MADHPKLAALKKLTTLLEGITIADGYSVDLAGKVFRGRMVFGDDDPVTMVSFIEQPVQDYGEMVGANQGRAYEFGVILQGFTTDDPLNPSDPMYEMSKDIEARLSMISEQAKNGQPVYPDIYLLNGTINTFKFSPGIVRPPDGNVSKRALLYMPIRIGLASRVG